MAYGVLALVGAKSSSVVGDPNALRAQGEECQGATQLQSMSPCENVD